MLQRVAACCSVLQCDAGVMMDYEDPAPMCVAVWCSVVQCVAV